MSTVDVWFDLRGSGLREALYVSLNRIPSHKQVLSLWYIPKYEVFANLNQVLKDLQNNNVLVPDKKRRHTLLKGVEKQQESNWTFFKASTFLENIQQNKRNSKLHTISK